MTKKALFTPKELKKFDYERDLGNAGEYPFTRGIHETMYSGGRFWTMRLFTGFDTAERTNERFHMLLREGETGLSTAFDMPTLLGWDSDNPRARLDVGLGGVAVDTLLDVEQIFKGIDLSQASTSMTINGPAIVLLSMYFELAKKQGVNLSQLRGTIQNDPLKEFFAQKEWIVPPRASVKLLVDTIEYCANHAQSWYPISISGYHIREAGASDVQELAFTLADGIAYVEACIERGMSVDIFAPRFSFFFDFANDWLREIAKIRAARRIWARVMRERFGAKNPRSWMMRTHIQTAGMTLTKEQPENNIARVALQALGAVLAGTQSLHTNSYDEQISLPSEKAAKIALRTQQIIAHETGVTNFIDPLGGSYVIESLTNEMEEAALEYIRIIEDMGGMVSAVVARYPHSEIEKSAHKFEKDYDGGKVVVVGKNKFAENEESKPEFRPDPEALEIQLAALELVKSKRDQNKVQGALSRLAKAARNGENCMEYVMRAVSLYATEQEICDVFRSVYGIYHEPVNL